MPRILDTSAAVTEQAEQGQTIRFLSIMEAVVTIEKQQDEYTVTFILSPVCIRQLVVIHEQTLGIAPPPDIIAG